MANKLTKEQQEVVDTLDRPLFVAAGAGSGKSSTLAERVCQAFLPGLHGEPPYLSSLDEVLVITFTHAAADEIKEKIRSRLREAGLVEQALQTDSAWISTIHGMCSRILHRHAFELGLDPQFQLVDETTAAAMSEAAIDTVMRDIHHDARFQDLQKVFELRSRKASGFGAGSPTVFGMVRDLRSAAASALDGFESLRFPGEEADVVGDARRLADVYEGLLLTGRDQKSFRSRTGQQAEKGLEASLERLGQLERLGPSRRTAEIIKAFDKLYKPARNLGNAAYKDTAADALACWRELQLDCCFAKVAPLAEDLKSIARMVDERYRAAKGDAGVLDNDDLLALTLRAFRDHPSIAEEYSDRFKLVMVDEFQDTNAQQVRMIELLSGPGACHLTTVGDSQQSIYRFRAADVQVFKDRETQLVATGSQDVIHLDRNFRSHADVLAFVERVLGQGLLPDFMTLKAAEHHRGSFLASHAPRADVELVSSQKGKRGVSRSTTTEQRKQLLASLLADRIARLIDEGEQAGRIVLLLGRMTHVDLYLQALRNRGISCVVSGGSTFSDSEDVRLVASLLHMLANPLDTDAGLFPVLSSDLFHLSADDFCVLSTTTQENGAYAKQGIERGFLNGTLAEGVEASEQLRCAQDVLRRALARVGSWPLGDVLEAILRESGWLARRQAEGTEGLSRAANALAAVRFATELADAHNMGPARAAEEFEEWLEVSKHAPASLSGGEAGAVRIMTVHASKGLQFPVVVAAECWGSSKTPSITGMTCENHDGEVECALVPPELGKDRDLKALFDEQTPEDAASCRTKAQWAGYLTRAHAQGEAAEKARLLYVAMTRAEEAVILGMDMQTNPDASHNARGTDLAEGVLDALLGPGLMPPIGESWVSYQHETGARARAVGSVEDERPRECRIRHVAVSLDEDGGLVCDAEGSFDVQEAEAPSQPEHLFAVYDSAVADGRGYELGAARPWQSDRGVESYSSLRRAAEQVAPDEGASSSNELRHPFLQLIEQDDPDDLGAAPSPEDEDRATDLGSAFHRIAQTMIVSSGSLALDQRVQAQERQWHLGPRTCSRLEKALARWKGSHIRQEALSHDVLQAEYPFFCVRPDGADGYLTGAIDLLATDKDSSAALVIDYKTGDRGLSLEQIYERHEMQAKVYASVLMEQGYSSVDCAFVCVERDAGELGGVAGEPLVVRYEFDDPIVVQF